MGKVIISGVGGQGVRVISRILATILTDLGYEVELLYDYDSVVRGAKSVAYLTWDKTPIANPVIDAADVILKLSNKAAGLTAERTICDTGLCTDEEVPFSKLGIENFGKEIFGNMIALGRLLRLINLEIFEQELEQALPLKSREENIRAIYYGYNLKEQDLGRGLDSTSKRELNFISEKPGTGDLEEES